ncbi:HotDog domain-containing protein [Delphinella strobiligena]|nr:HotDog domain-containing protein [Delphinella strobiligena]
MDQEAASDKSAEHAHIEKLIATKLPSSPIYAYFLSDVRVISATKGHVVCRLACTMTHMNSGGGLHGSVSATIIDWMGGMAICSHTLKDGSGVSVDIHATYLSSIKDGDEIEIEGLADKVGANMAFTTVHIYRVEEGKRGRAVVSGSHTKFHRP